MHNSSNVVLVREKAEDRGPYLDWQIRHGTLGRGIVVQFRTLFSGVVATVVELRFLTGVLKGAILETEGLLLALSDRVACRNHKLHLQIFALSWGHWDV